MKALATTFAALAILLPAARGATTFAFEGSDLTSTTGTALGTTVQLQGAYWETTDENGDPLTTPGFRADTSVTVLAADPSTMGYGAAISGKAVNGVDGPLMFTFASPLTIAGFSIALDNSPFGNIPTVGGDPAFGTNVLFYDSADHLIGFIPLDQTVPGFTVGNTATYTNVSKIVLPGGAYYDNMSLNTVPEPASAALAGLGVMLAFVRRRRA